MTVVEDLDPLSMLAADPLLRPPQPPSAPIVIDDPLSASSSAKLPEPVKAAAVTPTASTSASERASNKSLWASRKAQLKKDYSVTGKIKVSNLTWNEAEGTGVEDGSSVRKVDKYDTRLQTLEKRQYRDAARVEISQAEYESAVSKLSSNLDNAWSKDERVESLKIAIQLGKLLSNTNVAQFYPSMFVTVTDVLNHFGDLVFNRLFSKAEEGLVVSGKKGRAKLPENWTSEDVPSIAKDTCRNWLYKTACIRDLLPRIYVEIALLRCYRFLTDTDYPIIMNRIGNMIRGLGDPLIANYARMYLVLVGSEVAPSYNGTALALLQDILFTFRYWKESYLQNDPKATPEQINQYYSLFTPALEWILSSVGKGAPKETFQSILQLYRDQVNDSVALYYIIDSFDPLHWIHGTMGMITLIKSADISCISIVELFTALGKRLNVVPPPEELRMPILNEVWKIVSKSTDLTHYVKCASVWLSLCQKYYTEREMMVILGQVSNRVSQASASGETDILEPVSKQLEHLITNLIGQSSTFGSAVLSSEHLLKMLDVFKGIQKTQLCKEIIDSFRLQKKTTNDPVLINTLFDLARSIHDSVDGLSANTDITYNSFLLCSFIDLIDFGRDLEQQLNFYVDCRAAFPNLVAVKDKLIVAVNQLTMKAFRYVKGKHTKKTATFVKACLAYSHITIPSLFDVYRKLELSLQCAEIALLNQCLPQTDTFLKSAISFIPDVPAYYETDGKKVNYDDKLVEYISSLLAFLVVTPGHPEYGPFYIIQGLLNAVKKYNWNLSNNSTVSYHEMKIYLLILYYMTVMAQKDLPYHFPNVQSNDELYGNNKEYMTEVASTIRGLMEEVVVNLAKLVEKTPDMTENALTANKVTQVRLALDFINVLLMSMDLKQENLSFVLKLMELCQKNKSILTKNDSRYLILTNDYLSKKVESWNKVNNNR